LPEFDDGNLSTLAEPIEPIDVLAHDWEAEPVRACRTGLVGMTNPLIDPEPLPWPFALSTCEGAREWAEGCKEEIEFIPDAEDRWPMARAVSWAMMDAASGRS